MSDCGRFRTLIPLFAGEELRGYKERRVAWHLERCSRCQEEVESFRQLRKMARLAARVDEFALPEAARLRIAREAALRSSSSRWPTIAALRLLEVPVRPALVAITAALVLVLAVPRGFFRDGFPGVTQGAMKIDVVAQGGEVRLAWVDGHKDGYTVLKSPDPRSFSPHEAYRVDGHVFVDRQPDSWPVVFYKIE